MSLFDRIIVVKFVKIILFVLLACLGIRNEGKAQTYDIYANDGKYLGNTSSNRYDANSINNPYGQYGSKYSADSMRNSYGSYGSRYSTTSPNNRYAQPATAVPIYGGTPRNFGGTSRY